MSFWLLLSGFTQAATWKKVDTGAGPHLTWHKLCTATSLLGKWNRLVPCVSGFPLTISSSTTDYDIFTAARSSGWDGLTPLSVIVTVNPGVVVGASTTSSYAMTTGTGWPSGSSISLINNGYIVGRGGSGGYVNNYGSGFPGEAGGPGFHVLFPVMLTNNGVIGGGGGGGGSGCGPSAGCGGVANLGGGGGGFGTGGVSWQGVYGNSGGVYAGGAGVVGYYGGGGGGTGGSLGVPGNPGPPVCLDPFNGVFAYGAAGGAAGAAIVGNSLITWVSSGSVYGLIN